MRANSGGPPLGKGLEKRHKKTLPIKSNMQCATCKTSPVYHVCSKCCILAYCSAACANVDWDSYHHAEHDSGEHDADLVLQGKGNVWIGGIAALKDPNVMDEIDAVVSAIHEDRVKQCALDAYIGDRPRIRVSVWDVDEPEEAVRFQRHFDEVADFINEHVENGENVLVHCAAGISRSTTLVLYYMLKYRGYETVEEALAMVREARPDAEPNHAFLSVLE